MLHRFLFSLALLGLCATARSHTVWLEPVEGQIVMRFAEPDGKFETSPGYLDSLSPPSAFTLVTNSPLAIEVSKKSDHFLLTTVSPTNITCVESAFTVRAGRLPNFYARWQPANGGAGTPLLTFDLVPTGQPGEVRIYFRGQPLGGLKATLRTPDEKEQELTADAEGFLRFKAKESGRYLLTSAHHRETLPGLYKGRAYKETSHNTALTWRIP